MMCNDSPTILILLCDMNSSPTYYSNFNIVCDDYSIVDSTVIILLLTLLRIKI